MQWPRGPACRSPASVNWHRESPGFDPRPSQCVLRLLVCWKSGLSVYRPSSENRNDAGPVCVSGR